MQKLLSAGLAAGLFAVSGYALAADSAVISQNGGPAVVVTPGQTGDGYFPYLMGVVGTAFSTLDVTLDIPGSSSFGDFATFTIPTLANSSGSGAPLPSFISAGLSNSFSSFSVRLYSGVIDSYGTASLGTLLQTVTSSTTTGGTFSTVLNPGNYFFVVEGVANEFGGLHPKYNVTLNAVPVPEPGTYAMMIAGLAAMGFLAVRRKQS
jgi:PEP-CTERM motif